MTLIETLLRGLVSNVVGLAVINISTCSHFLSKSLTKIILLTLEEI